MSPVEHALTGMLASTLAASAWPGPLRGRGRWIAWTTIGAMAPDLDALSLLFSHRIYFGSAWYSHRQFLHSIFGCAFLAMLLPALVTALGNPGRDERARILGVGSRAVFAGGLIHLLGDLPTPPGPWGGLPLFFPLPIRVGGWGHLGWVNAVIFYFLAAAALAVAGLTVARRAVSGAARGWLRGAAAAVAAVALVGTVWFAAISRYEGFNQWRAWQSRFIPAIWVDGFYHAGRFAAVFWEREVVRLP
jgi:membrane-bound metal-dependent hydrolase YbcI (DUF457 family)